MNGVRLTLLLLAIAAAPAWADVAPVAIRVPEPKAWTGQKVSFFVDLRASGTFDGTASFSLPEIPRTVIIKLGNPVVASQEIEGRSWFVQTHEFALFTQQSGAVRIPSFEVRFASRDGFTGPVSDRTATVPQTSLEIQRPPGSDNIGFLVTAESIDISQSWEPQPAPAKVGDVFKRTISQSADQMTGIALPPPPQTAPGGIRVYLGNPVVSDNTERGSFRGQRQDNITYVLQESGSHALPAITYVWWNPKSEELRSKTLPAVTFEVISPRAPATSPASPERDTHALWWFAGATLICGLAVWKRDTIARMVTACWRMVNRPERVIARRLLRACRRNDAAAASAAWSNWLSLQEPEFKLTESLRTAALDLQRELYGTSTPDDWRGRSMGRAFRAQLAARRARRGRKPASKLPQLNPTS